MTIRFAAFVRLLPITAALVLVFASAGQAKEGFYLGGGYANQSVSGGLDGRKAFEDATGTVAILPGKPTAGSGLTGVVGYGVTPEIAIEYLYATTSHTASHDSVDINSDMTLTTSIYGLRFNVPITEELGFVGRLGLANGTATYDKYTLHGDIAGGTYTSTSEAEFSGSGYGFGAGLEYTIDKVGLSANYSLLKVSFDEAKGGGVSGELPSSLSSSISQVTLLVTYYFK